MHALSQERKRPKEILQNTISNISFSSIFLLLTHFLLPPPSLHPPSLLSVTHQSAPKNPEAEVKEHTDSGVQLALEILRAIVYLLCGPGQVLSPLSALAFSVK